jgi:hydroxypyruvate reductase 1
MTQVHNENGTKRVVVTKDLPGTRWLDILIAANCRVEVCAHEDFILSQTTIKTLMSDGCRQCHGVIGQLTEVRNGTMLMAVCAHTRLRADAS